MQQLLRLTWPGEVQAVRWTLLATAANCWRRSPPCLTEAAAGARTLRRPWRKSWPAATAPSCCAARWSSRASHVAERRSHLLPLAAVAMSRLWPEGESISVQTDDARPARCAFTWQGAATHRLAQIQQRWQVDTDWWSEAGRIWRDYVAVTTTDGLLCVHLSGLARRKTGFWPSSMIDRRHVGVRRTALPQLLFAARRRLFA